MTKSDLYFKIDLHLSLQQGDKQLKFIAIIQMKNDNGLDQGGSSGNSEKWWASVYILSMESTGLIDKLYIVYEKRNKWRITSRFGLNNHKNRVTVNLDGIVSGGNNLGGILGVSL